VLVDLFASEIEEDKEDVGEKGNGPVADSEPCVEENGGQSCRGQSGAFPRDPGITGVLMLSVKPGIETMNSLGGIMTGMANTMCRRIIVRFKN
jgi:hypothetical protein